YNLISNAMKFTPEGGEVKLDIKISESAGANNSSANGSEYTNPIICISVIDTGIGIPENELDKVFDRFYQVDGSQTRANEGTGIGLALSKELAELMRGSIYVESESGKGSSFIFSLPVQAPGSTLITEKPINV